MSKKATLGLSDVHYGDRAQLHGTLQECMGRAIDLVVSYAPVETEVLVDGDMVAGRGIYRDQEMQNSLQFGAEQCWFAAHDILAWQERLRATRWLFIQGNHDYGKGENLAKQLVAILQLLNVPAQFCGRQFTGNFSLTEQDGCWYEAEHGFSASDFYANSYSEIRAMARKYIERSKRDGINLSRVLLGHTHWPNIGQRVGDDFVLDTFGGWHRQERAKLPSDVRDTGVLLYFHDGATLDIRDLRANRDLLFDESRDVGQAYRVMAAQATALAKMTAWAHERGLC